jgi:aminopeptidase N
MKYKYQKKDFLDFPLTQKHLDIHLNFFDDRVEARCTLHLLALEDLTQIKLDAQELKIISVEAEGKALEYDYQKKQNKLVIKKAMKKGDGFKLTTITHCFPSDNNLEGIYKDATPDGCPQQYVSQCEMWGFQRIMPAVDDPRGKCTFLTTLEADAQYTHLITNGNIKVPMKKDGKRKSITYENSVPMAPYLFLALAGTWDELNDSFTYPSGKIVQLEYLVPPGKEDEARIPMEILKKSLAWIHKTQNYEYNRDVYRTITVNKADFGGMENVGNTIIVTDAALMNEHTLDGFLVYAHQVIVHEFEHNQCGSDTTMETPFDIWLNEAYTVDVDRQFAADVFGIVFARLQNVRSIRDPLLGPLAIEDSGFAGRIVREGFNDPNEMIDGVTYVKAAEVIRMLRLIMGRVAFRKAAKMYFEKYKDSNANTQQFFEIFEKVHGKKLDRFKNGWLYQQGYPKVTATSHWDERTRTYSIDFKQDKDFHIPIEIGLVDEEGNDIATAMIEMDKSARFEKQVQLKPAFASINRDYSFYGILDYKQPREELEKQALIDPNIFNRVEAFARLTDMERIKLMLDPKAKISEEWIALFGKLLKSGLSSEIKAQMLAITEQPLERKYAAWFPEQYDARTRLVTEVNSRYRTELLRLFKSLDTYSEKGLVDGIKDRSLKGVLLGFLSVADDKETHELIIDHYKKSTSASDRLLALVAINRSKYPGRRKIMDEAFRKWKSDLSGYANYLRVISNGKHADYFKEIEAETKKAEFDEKNPTYSRALIVNAVTNTKMVWTREGLEWAKDNIIKYATINYTVASRMLNMFQFVKMMKPEWQKIVRKHLEEIAEKVTVENNAAVHNQATSYLS